MHRVIITAIVLLLVAATVAVSARPYAAPCVVRAGTPVDVVLQVSLDTEASEAGDRFSARVAAPIMVDGKVAVPRGHSCTGMSCSRTRCRATVVADG
jgi:hypothetical protein